jgi:hypothetical protein
MLGLLLRKVVDLLEKMVYHWRMTNQIPQPSFTNELLEPHFVEYMKKVYPSISLDRNTDSDQTRTYADTYAEFAWVNWKASCFVTLMSVNNFIDKMGEIHVQ